MYVGMYIYFKYVNPYSTYCPVVTYLTLNISEYFFMAIQFDLSYLDTDKRVVGHFFLTQLTTLIILNLRKFSKLRAKHGISLLFNLHFLSYQ